MRIKKCSTIEFDIGKIDYIQAHNDEYSYKMSIIIVMSIAR